MQISARDVEPGELLPAKNRLNVKTHSFALQPLQRSRLRDQWCVWSALGGSQQRMCGVSVNQEAAVKDREARRYTTRSQAAAITAEL